MFQNSYYVVGEGLWTFDDAQQPTCSCPVARDEVRMFRFSRLGPQGEPTDPALNKALAKAMTPAPTATQPDSTADGIGSRIPAGFTYIGQFADHDLTQDPTALAPDDEVTVDKLVSGRSPALDLDSVYGRGPQHPQDQRFYAADGIKLKTGTTEAFSFPPGIPDLTNPNPPGTSATNVDRDGFDLPRVGTGPTKAAQREALIPDTRRLRSGRRRVHQRPEVLRGHRQLRGRHDHLREHRDHADRVLGGRLPAGPQHDPRRIPVEPRVQQRLAPQDRHPVPAVHLQRDQRHPHRHQSGYSG
ncbi:MAG: hypothetical protein ACRDRP_07845 [Pseudonocardiaceae bacterium]